MVTSDNFCIPRYRISCLFQYTAVRSRVVVVYFCFLFLDPALPWVQTRGALKVLFPPVIASDKSQNIKGEERNGSPVRVRRLHRVACNMFEKKNQAVQLRRHTYPTPKNQHSNISPFKCFNPCHSKGFKNWIFFQKEKEKKLKMNPKASLPTKTHRSPSFPLSEVTLDKPAAIGLCVTTTDKCKNKMSKNPTEHSFTFSLWM